MREGELQEVLVMTTQLRDQNSTLFLIGRLVRHVSLLLLLAGSRLACLRVMTPIFKVVVRLLTTIRHAFLRATCTKHNEKPWDPAAKGSMMMHC